MEFSLYGFIKPNGEFVEIEYGDHGHYCLSILKEDTELRKRRIDIILSKKIESSSYLTDFFVEELGWILLHDPSLACFSIETSKTKKITKAQKETLSDYYIFHKDKWKDKSVLKNIVYPLLNS